MRLLLDTNVLLKICHPKQHPDAKQWLSEWLEAAQRRADVDIMLPAVAEYELRRGHLRKLHKHPDEKEALKRLDAVCERMPVQQLSHRHWRIAAEFWADARRGGYPTAPERDIDWDVVIASQANALDAIVVTQNATHLRRYGVEARDWADLPAPAA